MEAQKNNIFEIEIGSDKYKLYFKRPNQADLFKIDLKYRQIFSEAVKAGVMTESQIRKELAKNGAWTQEDEDRVSRVAVDIANLHAVMNALRNNKEEREGVIQIIGKITELRATLLELIATRTNMLAQSAEGIANEQRMHKLTELCLYDSETGARFFSSTEEYQEYAATQPDALSEIFKQAHMFEYGQVDLDIEKYPEMIVLREISEQEKTEEKEKALQESTEAPKPEVVEEISTEKPNKKKKAK